MGFLGAWKKYKKNNSNNNRKTNWRYFKTDEKLNIVRVPRCPCFDATTRSLKSRRHEPRHPALIPSRRRKTKYSWLSTTHAELRWTASLVEYKWKWNYKKNLSWSIYDEIVANTIQIDHGKYVNFRKNREYWFHLYVIILIPCTW